MANILSTEKQVAVISALAEGSAIRQIERITGVHRDTIMRLGVRVGQRCAKVLDSEMRGFACQQLQSEDAQTSRHRASYRASDIGCRGCASSNRSGV